MIRFRTPGAAVLEYKWSSGLTRVLGRGGVPEKERYAPSRRQRHKNIDDPAYNGSLAAEDPGNEVEAENPDKPPVKAADYQEHKRQFIYPHIFSAFRINLRIYSAEVVCAYIVQILQKIR